MLRDPALLQFAGDYKSLTLTGEGRLEIESGYDEFAWWEFTPDELRQLRDWLVANVKD